MCKESYDALLDIEKMGVQIRDVDDEFAGAEFRDEETKLMFAYDYENKYCIRIRGGANIKPAMYNECKRLGVTMYEHVMVTSLLTEGGKQGARVVGATGVNVRTGEFYIFKAKATILSMNAPVGLWVFSMELKGGHPFLSTPTTLVMARLWHGRPALNLLKWSRLSQCSFRRLWLSCHMEQVMLIIPGMPAPWLMPMAKKSPGLTGMGRY